VESKAPKAPKDPKGYESAPKGVESPQKPQKPQKCAKAPKAPKGRKLELGAREAAAQVANIEHGPIPRIGVKIEHGLYCVAILIKYYK
jgi:hypothetical protein